MKRIISVILVLALILMTAACGADSGKDSDKDSTVKNVSDNVQTDNDSDNAADKDGDTDKTDDQADKTDKNDTADKNSSNKGQDTNKDKNNGASDKPQNGGQSDKPDANDKNDQTDSSTAGASVAQTLLADFKSCAGSMGAQAIADRMIANDVIKFSGGTMAVSPGVLAGFGNTEITGFSEGVMFSPVIGTIPFIGYIFVLDDGTDAAEFVKVLKSNADQRWNICTQADETVVSNVGNKVFFVMSPKSFE